MGTITNRRRRDGSTGYTAQIRVTREGRVVHSESETFDRRALAEQWLRRREGELDTQRARGEPRQADDRRRDGDLVRGSRERALGPNEDHGHSPDPRQWPGRQARRPAHPPRLHRLRREPPLGRSRDRHGRQRPDLAAGICGASDSSESRTSVIAGYGLPRRRSCSSTWMDAAGCPPAI